MDSCRRRNVGQPRPFELLPGCNAAFTSYPKNRLRDWMEISRPCSTSQGSSQGGGFRCRNNDGTSKGCVPNFEFGKRRVTRPKAPARPPGLVSLCRRFLRVSAFATRFFRLSFTRIRLTILFFFSPALPSASPPQLFRNCRNPTRPRNEPKPSERMVCLIREFHLTLMPALQLETEPFFSLATMVQQPVPPVDRSSETTIRSMTQECRRICQVSCPYLTSSFCRRSLNARSHRIAAKKSTPVKVEAKVWFANERTWVSYINISVLMSTLSLAMWNASSDKATTWFAYSYGFM